MSDIFGVPVEDVKAALERAPIALIEETDLREIVSRLLGDNLIMMAAINNLSSKLFDLERRVTMLDDPTRS